MHLLLAALIVVLTWVCCNGSGNFGHQPFGNGRPPENTKFYDILEVGKDCNQNEIKKAYHKKAMIMHPDRGGNTEDFKGLLEAYTVLSDPKKRELYDRYGMEGLQEGPNQAASGDDLRNLFRDFGNQFGGGGFNPFSGFAGFPLPPIQLILEIKLEDLYSGKRMRLSIDNQFVDINILPGMQNGMEIFARGQFRDQRGNPRDLLFQVKEHPHTVFERRNADLKMQLNITLYESLFGFTKSVRLLDGKDIWVKTRDGETVSPDDVFVLEGMGMPLCNDRVQRGRLFITTKLSIPRDIPFEGEALESFRSLVHRFSSPENPYSGQSAQAGSHKSKNPRRRDAKSGSFFGAAGVGTKNKRGEVDPSNPAAGVPKYPAEGVQTPEGMVPHMLQRGHAKAFGALGANEAPGDEGDGGDPFFAHFFR